AHLEPVHRLDEMTPVRRPPELAVGHQVEPEVLLHLHNVCDGLVLNASEFGVAELAGPVPAKRLPQRRRPQQAADVMGADHVPASSATTGAKRSRPAWKTT